VPYKVAIVQAYKQEADLLRHENKRLRSEIERQKAAFLKKIDELKALLKAATEKVESWMRRARLLEQEVSAPHVEAGDLRRQLEGRPEPSGSQLRV
jgi:predicted RNase H-like nuclease (RuvC/YqgF family)